jgi:hypothetical protein
MESEHIIFRTVKITNPIRFGYNAHSDYRRSGYKAIQLADTKLSWRINTKDYVPLLF